MPPSVAWGTPLTARLAAATTRSARLRTNPKPNPNPSRNPNPNPNPDPNPNPNTLCQSFDFERRGKIALDSFIAMVILLENAKRLHAAFDPNRTGTASFDMNQFVWALALL